MQVVVDTWQWGDEIHFPHDASWLPGPGRFPGAGSLSMELVWDSGADTCDLRTGACVSLEAEVEFEETTFTIPGDPNTVDVLVRYDGMVIQEETFSPEYEWTYFTHWHEQPFGAPAYEVRCIQDRAAVLAVELEETLALIEALEGIPGACNVSSTSETSAVGAQSVELPQGRNTISIRWTADETGVFDFWIEHGGSTDSNWALSVTDDDCHVLSEGREPAVERVRFEAVAGSTYNLRIDPCLDGSSPHCGSGDDALRVALVDS